MTNGEVTEAGGAYFTTEICADYRDELSRDALEAMADSAHPFDEFYAWLDSVYGSEVDATWDRLATRCAEDLGLEFETAWEFITEMVDVQLPIQHYLAQEFRVDILVDTGDANLDFSANCIAPAWGGYAPEDAPEEASIFWLAKQQGYGREQVVAALRGQETASLFLKSLVREVENETSGMNALTLLCRMTVGEWMDVQAEMRNPLRKGALRLPKSVTCGLFDAWYGGGSVLEIELERDVTLPLRIVHEITTDLGLGRHSVDEVYGFVSSVWNTAVQFEDEEGAPVPLHKPPKTYTKEEVLEIARKAIAKARVEMAAEIAQEIAERRAEDTAAEAEANADKRSAKPVAKLIAKQTAEPTPAKKMPRYVAERTKKWDA